MLTNNLRHIFTEIHHKTASLQDEWLLPKVGIRREIKLTMKSSPLKDLLKPRGQSQETILLWKLNKIVRYFSTIPPQSHTHTQFVVKTLKISEWNPKKQPYKFVYLEMWAPFKHATQVFINDDAMPWFLSLNSLWRPLN